MAYDLPSCEECQRVVYDGISAGRARKKTSNFRKEFPRIKEMPPPCFECPKLTAEDKRENPRPEMAAEVTERQRAALQYYRMMKHDRRATLPYDNLTLYLNSVIEQAELEAREAREASNSPVIVLGGGK